MENQHRKIKGYRELNQTEIDFMNEVKTMGVKLGELNNKILSYAKAQADCPLTEEDNQALRWLAEGKTDLQKGLMSWTRSIARPEFF